MNACSLLLLATMFATEPPPADTAATAAATAATAATAVQCADSIPAATLAAVAGGNLYDRPYSMWQSHIDWRRAGINTGVYVMAGVATLLTLELLPDDATAWNSAERQQVPFFKRWSSNVKAGPVWDHDKPIFNWVLLPYAGAVYYTSGRSCGMNVWQAALYCTLVSNVLWEYGIEAFNEVPSRQDMIVTPLSGLLLGETFYCAKRAILARGYRVLGSTALGRVLVWLIDPFNEFINLFDRRGRLTTTATITPGRATLALTLTL